VTRWTCPECDREFGAARQAHTCVPGNTVDETFAGRPAAWRAVYDALLARLAEEGPVHEDAVKVGVFLLHERKFAEVRPMVRSVKVYLFLPRRLDHPRVAAHLAVSADRVMHTLKLTSPDEVDDELAAWLAEAYDAAAG
jgi:uncharacterized protein DUF5655